MSLSSIPPEECSIRSAASLRRVPLGWFPAFIGNISRLRLLELHPARLRCLHLAVPVVYRCSLRQIAIPSCQPGPFLQRRPRRYSNGRERDLPGSWRTLANMLRSSTPVDRSPLARARRTMWPSAQKTTSAPHTVSFRGSITQPISSLCTLRSRGHPQNHATLGSGGWLILTGSGLAPAGFQQEVSILVLSFTQIFSSSKLGLAHFPLKRPDY